MLETGQEQEKTRFFNLFVQISGRIWTVVGRGYFSHASSYRENVASARRVKTLRQSADGELPNNLLLALGACDEDRISQTSIVFWSLPALYLNFDLILIRSKLANFASQKLANFASQSLQIPGEQNTEQLNFFCPEPFKRGVPSSRGCNSQYMVYVISAFGPFGWDKKYQESASSTTQTLV